MATKEDIERFPYRIEIEDEKTLSVIVEGRKPNCYLCGTRGHIKKECPLYEFVAECEQELEEKKNTVNEKENIEKETKQQEKGNNKSMKEKEIKEKKEIEPKQSQEKKKEKETTGKKQERDQNQTKRKDGTQKEKEKEHKTREKERTDKEPKRQEKEGERKEGKKREREKQREENKEEISPKRKMKENVGRKQDYCFYKLVTFHFCPEMKDLTSNTEGHVWVNRMTDQWQETALIPEERVAEFLRAAGESVTFYTSVRVRERLPEGSVMDFRELKTIMEYV
ncbi:---NA--- [Octopus vulgaris]|uniref:---NA n=1 Tax=Octopus vulgaris TaxID=6645 RepID=A0AA36AN56_OCTVU|nr:---NA--- [Octopus vulgaris]